ncbi:DNA repair protein RadC [Qipengyuania sp. MTN3-11]
MPEPGAKAPAHSGTGHRARLRQRLLDGGDEALADYELLEFLLFAAVRQGDTKPAAKALIARFGSLAGVLNADAEALKGVKGVGDAGAAAIRSVSLAARRMARGKVRDMPVLSSWQALLDYLAIDMGSLTRERVRVLYLNTRNRLVLDHLAHEGTIDEAAIHPREVIRKALDLGATALILVHNHPSGSPEPSRADIAITRRIAEAGAHLGITVHDHVIIAGDDHVSLRAKGLI